MPDFPALDTPETLARFLVMMGYTATEVAATVHRDFPAADVDAVIATAIAKRDAEARAMGRTIEQDEAAVAAEHDLTKTIHPEDR